MKAKKGTNLMKKEEIVDEIANIVGITWIVGVLIILLQGLQK